MKQYLDLLKRILLEGEDVQSGAVIKSEDRKATCRMLLAQQLRFDLREGFPIVHDQARAVRHRRRRGALVPPGRDQHQHPGPQGPGHRTTIGRPEGTPTWHDQVHPAAHLGPVGRPYRATSPTSTARPGGTGTTRSWSYPARQPGHAQTMARSANGTRSTTSWRGSRPWPPTRPTGPGGGSSCRAGTRRMVPEMGLAPCHTLSPVAAHQRLPGRRVRTGDRSTCSWAALSTSSSTRCWRTIFGGFSGLIPRHLVRTSPTATSTTTSSSRSASRSAASHSLYPT